MPAPHARLLTVEVSLLSLTAELFRKTIRCSSELSIDIVPEVPLYIAPPNQLYNSVERIELFSNNISPPVAVIFIVPLLNIAPASVAELFLKITSPPEALMSIVPAL